MCSASTRKLGPDRSPRSRCARPEVRAITQRGFIRLALAVASQLAYIVGSNVRYGLGVKTKYGRHTIGIRAVFRSRWYEGTMPAAVLLQTDPCIIRFGAGEEVSFDCAALSFASDEKMCAIRFPSSDGRKEGISFCSSDSGRQLSQIILDPGEDMRLDVSRTILHLSQGKVTFPRPVRVAVQIADRIAVLLELVPQRTLRFGPFSLRIPTIANSVLCFDRLGELQWKRRGDYEYLNPGPNETSIYAFRFVLREKLNIFDGAVTEKLSGDW